MKNLFNSAMFIAVVAMTFMSTGCSKDANVESDNNIPMATMTITAGNEALASDGTRTEYNNGKILWNTVANSEVLEVFETIDGATPSRAVTASFTNEAGKAKFTVSFTAHTTGAKYDYAALYPNTAIVESSNTDATNLKINLPNVQNPTTTSYDPACDLMITMPKTGSTQATNLDMQFGRIVAFGHMAVANLGIEANEFIKTVKFIAPNKIVAGRGKVNMATGSVYPDQWGYAGGIYAPDNIEMKYAENTITTAQFDAWFTCAPFTLTATDKFTVEILTSRGTYTREVTLTDGKEISFTMGNISSFGVDMATATFVETFVDKSIFTLPFGSATANTTYTTKYDMEATGVGATDLVYTFSATSNQIRANSNQFADADYTGASAKAFWWASNTSLTISNITLDNAKLNYALSFGGKTSQSTANVKIEISKDGTNFFPISASEVALGVKANGNMLKVVNFSFESVVSEKVSIKLTAGANAVIDDIKLAALDVAGENSYLVYFLIPPTLTSTPANGEALTFEANNGTVGNAPDTQNISYTWGGNDCTFAATKSGDWFTITDDNSGTITVTPTENTSTTATNEGTVTLTVTKDGLDAKTNVINIKQLPAGVAVKTWKMVTDISTLAASDNVIIVCPSSNVVLSTTKSSGAAYLGYTSVVITNNEITTAPADATIFTVGIDVDKYTFASNSQYMNCTGAKAVKMGALGDISKWGVTIANEVATLSANTPAYGNLKYNNSSPRFTTYPSGQTDIALFKEQ